MAKPAPEPKTALRINASAIDAKEVLFSVYQGRITFAFKLFMATSAIAIGGTFLYSGFLVKNIFCNLAGILLFVPGVVSSFGLIKNRSKPVLLATKRGIFLDILIFNFGSLFFLSWESVKNIFEGSEKDFQRLPLSNEPLSASIKKLGIELNKNDIKIFPMAVKNITYGQGWDSVPDRFFLNSIDISPHDAAKKLLSIKNSGKPDAVRRGRVS